MRPLAALSIPSPWAGREGEGGHVASAVDFAELYRQYFDFVWRVVRGHGVAPALLEDATQDVFLVVHRRLPDFQPNASHKTWIFAIAVRVAKDYRRRATRKGGPVPLDDDLVAAASENPFDAAARGQALRIVDAYLETLDEDRRSVFILSEVEQMTAPEIAATLGANLNTVYSRIRAVRHGFAEAVNRLHGADGGQDDTTQIGDDHG